jgi:hypothetical protein
VGGGGEGEGGLDSVVRWRINREGALLPPVARLSERARRSSVGGSMFIDADFVDALPAPPTEVGRLDNGDSART